MKVQYFLTFVVTIVLAACSKSDGPVEPTGSYSSSTSNPIVVQFEEYVVANSTYYAIFSITNVSAQPVDSVGVHYYSASTEHFGTLVASEVVALRVNTGGSPAPTLRVSPYWKK